VESEALHGNRSKNGAQDPNALIQYVEASLQGPAEPMAFLELISAVLS
jgi:hypothetical protein